MFVLGKVWTCLDVSLIFSQDKHTVAALGNNGIKEKNAGNRSVRHASRARKILGCKIKSNLK